MSNQTLVSNQTLSPNLCFLWDDKLHYLSLNGMCIWRPALAAFLLASPIAAAASAAAAAADGLRVSLVCEGEPPWCEFGFTLPGLKWAARASTSRIVAFKFPSTISKKRKNYFQDFEGKTWSDCPNTERFKSCLFYINNIKKPHHQNFNVPISQTT